MNQFKKSLKTYKMVEPVYNNLFEVRFKSNALGYHDAVTLTEQVIRFGYSLPSEIQNTFGIDFGIGKTIDISFNQNLINGRSEPLATIEDMRDILAEDKGGALDIHLYLFDREGVVFRKVKFTGCKIKNIDSGTEFDYTSQDIRELYLTLTYDSVKAENNAKK